MILSIILIIISIAGFLTAKKYAPQLMEDFRGIHLLIVLAVELSGLMIGLTDTYGSSLGVRPEIERPAPGSADKYVELECKSGGESNNMRVKISAREPSADEAFTLIEKAKEEIDMSFLGDNISSGEIYRPVCMKDSYCDGMVKVKWSVDRPKIMELNGRLHTSRIKKPEDLAVTADLSCGETGSQYELDVTVIPPPMDTPYGFAWHVRRALRKSDAEDPGSDSVTLPGEAGGEQLVWRNKKSHRGAQLSGLGAVLAAAVVIAGREDKKRQAKKRAEALARDYPNIVSALCLYVSAGVSVKSSFRRIASQYADEDEGEHPGYAAVRKLCRSMDDGEGELTAYTVFGRETGHRDYSRLSLMLTQNIKKGSRTLVENLEKEEAAAFEDRKMRARVAGEEASTRLLIPMGMLLAVVMAVMIMPSVANLNI